MTAPTPDHAEQDLGVQLDNEVPGRGDGRVPVVGLGGAAGASPALQAFFRDMPADSGLAFVVLGHQGERDGELAALLRDSTAMPVHEVDGRVRLQPDTVYLIPPSHALRADDDCLALDERPGGHGRHVAVDLFFRTLGDTHGVHSAAVILSGPDGDGAIGIKRIKERGGLTIAQDPEEAEQGSMPRAAIATGMVDWVLPVADMPQRLLGYFRLCRHLQLPAEELPPDGSAPPAREAGADEAHLRDILAFLRTRTGRDFAAYKRATVVRRIARRMQVNGTDNMTGYLSFLRTRPGESSALLQDLLISVTNFFRDADCFAALEPQLQALLHRKAGTEAVRIWVAGCATGEEAYSLAMLLCDMAREMEAPPIIQVFATDLDEEAIRVAREGVYPATIEADVSQDRLRRYFTREHRGYRVRREVREMVLFAQHDVLKDSPFSRLDLVSCRNLLIYLNREAQQRVFQTFHFALQPQGLMFLGASETCEDASALFTVVDKKHRIFMQRPMPRATVPVPSGTGTLARVLQDQPVLDIPTIGGRAFEAPPAPGRPRHADERGVSWGSLHLKMLEALAPPSILVDGEYDIVHLSPGAGRFLQFAGGEPSRNLLRSIHPALRIEMRAALYQAAQSGEAAEVHVARTALPEGERSLAIRVWPAREMGTDLFMVMLDARAPEAAASTDVQRPDPVASQLDRELERLKVQLRDTVEQYEASTEELKASNEELQAMNDELRSATEELETSREELQSINEELSTVNQELKNKVDELAHANSDMHNLMDATAIATIFLDRDLCIMRYTPSAVQLFKLIPTDVGRPLADLSSRVDYRLLADDAARVLDRLVPIERELPLPDGSWYLTRLLPYRTLEDRIAGVVLSFIDVTERKRAEEVQLWLSAVVNATSDGIVSFAPDLTVLSWNGGAERIFGWSAHECIGQSLSIIAPGREREQQENVRRILKGETLRFESVRRRKDGVDIHVALSVSPIRDVDGRVIGGTTVARDVTDAKRAQEALRASEERLRLVVEKAREYAIFSIDLERRVTSWNTGAERLLGYAGGEVMGRSADVIFTAEDRMAGAAEKEAETALRDGRASDDRFHVRKDGSRFWASGVSMRMDGPDGRPCGFVKILRDMTDERLGRERLERSQAELMQALQETQAARRQLEEADAAKDRFLAVLAHELRNPLASIASSAELLQVARLPEAAREKAAQVVQRQARAMKVLLDDLLDVSRLSLGRLKIMRRPVSIGAVIESGIEASRPLLQAARHELTLHMPAHEIEVDADPLRLAQVVSNLVSNASKYTPEGGRITVAAEVADKEVVITVSDSGIGMDPAEINRMFDPFAQGHAGADHPNAGFGIGLALARSIVEQHGGWIMASSEGPGRGSQLRIGLPLLRTGQARREAPAPALQPPTAAPVPPEDAPLILVADDNGDAAWGMAKLLELSGYRAMTASSGAEAITLAQQHRPAIALVDIGMPDISGHEVARQLRAAPWARGMILIAATGWGQESDVQQSLQAGFDAHLTKPLNVGRIKAVLDELQERRGRA